MSFILVQSHMNLFEDACNAVPFSWRIRDYLEELWVQAQYITDTEGKDSPRPPQGTADELTCSRQDNFRGFSFNPLGVE